MKITHAGIAAALLIIASTACQSRQEPPPPAPTVEVEVDPETKEPLQAGQLRSNQIRTRHVFDGAVTSGKLGIKAVTATVTAASAAVTTSADPDIAGGLLLGCYPSTNQDQFIDNIVLNANGSITVTLAANATANNVFTCRVMKANAKGVT